MHPYMGKKAVLSTMHGKQQAIVQPFKKFLNVSIQVPNKINTDMLGTFSGEIERELTPLETLRKKARMGMEELGLPLGIASEGSFGPHRYLPWVAEDHEILLWIDEERGIEVIEHEVSGETNFDAKTISTFNDLKDFLDKVHFPSHALVVRPNSGFIQGFTFKGLKRASEVKEAIDLCTSASADGLVYVETDMRAHRNPTRMKVINKLAEKLAVRLMNFCPNCCCPGWGVIDVVRGLPCEACGLRTKQIAQEVYGCPSCNFKKEEPRQDGVTTSSPTYCDWCNP
ncbi:DUF6671 family protein [Metabacillus herbersteinensis]|uniref:DUF6671 family protein n=2 Tax=Metabacillus herbersteinensis TaxID=283816 RepID=A0ABV6GJT3_9BACI